jgi:hypothetical protein
MENSERQQFSRMVTAFRNAFKTDTDAATSEVYWMVLQRFDFDAVKMAFVEFASKGNKFAPTPGEIVEIIEGATDADAHAAWLAVDKAIDDHGPYCCPDFGIDAIHATIRELGGWVRMCNMMIPEEPFRRKEFIECYKVHKARGAVSPDPLPGIRGFHEVKRIELPRQLRQIANQGRKQIKSGTETSDGEALRNVMAKVDGM